MTIGKFVLGLAACMVCMALAWVSSLFLDVYLGLPRNLAWFIMGSAWSDIARKIERS